jgi:muramoyltetrapeptide carboxypeptidase
LRRLRRLRRGDAVAVVAPSGPVRPDALRRGCAVLEGLGLRVRVGRHVLERGTHLPANLAGPDLYRAGDLEEAWCDPEVRAVVCARGGYGATRLLPLLDWERMGAAAPPLLIGASDATALHAAVAARLGVASLFGPMPATAVLGGSPRPDPETVAALRRALTEAGPLRLGAPAARALVPGRARGRAVGGTLSLLAALAGTPWLPESRGALLVLEDVGEAPYRVDRMLTQLEQAGWLRGVAGVVLGSWERCGDVQPVLRDRLAGLGVPVLGGLPVGHGRPQLSLPLGVPATLDADAGTLTYDPPAAS